MNLFNHEGQIFWKEMLKPFENIWEKEELHKNYCIWSLLKKENNIGNNYRDIDIY